MNGKPTLENGWAAQEELQRILYNDVFPRDFDTEQKIQYLKDMYVAAIKELGEALDEVGWKPWATSRHIDREAFLSELVDTWQFLMNMMTAVGATPEEVATILYHKHMVNYRRIRDGYEARKGVDKCRECGRALDDPHVKCTTDTCMFQAIDYR